MLSFGTKDSLSQFCPRRLARLHQSSQWRLNCPSPAAADDLRDEDGPEPATARSAAIYARSLRTGMGTGTRGIQATKNEPTIDSGTALLRAAGMASSGQVKIEIPGQLSRQHIQVSLHAPLGRGLSRICCPLSKCCSVYPVCGRA